MTDRAALLIWTAAGKPDPRKRVHAAAGVCYWCGSVLDAAACRMVDVCGSAFTDHDLARAPASQWVCAPCTWTMTGRPPDTLRLWSLIYREDRPAAPSHAAAPALGARIHLSNKADPSGIDVLLRAPPESPWVCTVADSGQLHVVPFAQVNRGPTFCVRFERADVRGTAADYGVIADAQQALLDGGFSKADIASCPSPGHLSRALPLWRRHDAILAPHRGRPLFALSLFLRRRTLDA